jgi:PAS domain S-box-containing protein
MWGYSEEEAITMSVDKLIPDGARAQAGALWTRLRRGARINSSESRRQTKDGRVLDVWVTITALVDEAGIPFAVGETIRDITERKQLEREVVKIATLEQQRIGHDLHDSVGQELTALNLLAGDLAQTLRTDAPNAPKLVEQIMRGLKRSQRELRAVLHGLLPVAVDSEGLMAALSDLAERIHEEKKVACRFECSTPVSIADNHAATQLYLIAQEAAHNAVKHAQALNIRIDLNSADLLTLCVRDDGIGVPEQSIEYSRGLGLRIMRNRAAIIGATLTIERVQPHGTAVTCSLPRNTHGTTSTNETSQSPDRRRSSGGS